MIKFFRKIRQRLLTENKFSKYLIYAIGEIILIVIGILIAVQIGSWKSEQVNHHELINSLNELDREIQHMQWIGTNLVEKKIPLIRERVDSLKNRTMSPLQQAQNFMVILEHPEFPLVRSSYNQIVEKLIKQTGDNRQKGLSRKLIAFYGAKSKSITEAYNDLKATTEKSIDAWTTEQPWFEFRHIPDSMVHYNDEFLNHYSYRNQLEQYSEAIDKYKLSLLDGLRELATVKVYLDQITTNSEIEDYPQIFEKNFFNVEKLNPCNEVNYGTSKSIDGYDWSHTFIINLSNVDIKIRRIDVDGEELVERGGILPKGTQTLSYSSFGGVLQFIRPDGDCQSVMITKIMGSIILK